MPLMKPNNFKSGFKTADFFVFATASPQDPPWNHLQATLPYSTDCSARNRLNKTEIVP